MIPTPDHPPDHPSSPLHLSQKFFWFAAGISLLAGTAIFSWQVYRGQKSSVELGAVKFTIEQAAQSVAVSKDELLAIRTRLDDGVQRQDFSDIENVVADIDGLLKTLGVAEAALKRQRASLSYDGTGYDTYYPSATTIPITSQLQRRRLGSARGKRKPHLPKFCHIQCLG
jgi:hypothetical protein